MSETLNFGKWVRKQRKARNLSVAECARRSAMVPQQWVRLEADEPKRKDGSPPMPTRKTVARVASALEIGENDVLSAAGYAVSNPHANIREVQVDGFDDLPLDQQELIRELVMIVLRKYNKDER